MGATRTGARRWTKNGRKEFGMPGRFMRGGNVFVCTRELDEWMEEYGGWVDVCFRMAVRRELQAKRAEVPPRTRRGCRRGYSAILDRPSGVGPPARRRKGKFRKHEITVRGGQACFHDMNWGELARLFLGDVYDKHIRPGAEGAWFRAVAAEGYATGQLKIPLRYRARTRNAILEVRLDGSAAKGRP